MPPLYLLAFSYRQLRELIGRVLRGQAIVRYATLTAIECADDGSATAPIDAYDSY
jgi:hypothetical protein